MTDSALDYIPGLISAYKAGHAGDHVHLGYWAEGASHGWRTAQEAMTELHLDALDLQNRQTIIDIGCGIGGSLRLMNERLRKSRLIGVNIDPRQLAICQAHIAMQDNRLEWLHCDACNVTQPDGCADRILSLEALFHFTNRQTFLSEAARLLRPNGRLICSDIVFKQPHNVHQQRLLKVVQQGYAPWPTPIMNLGDMDQLGRNAGLKLLHMRDLSVQVMPTWDHIVPSHDDPLVSPVAAIRELHQTGLLLYPMYLFEKTTI